MIKIAEVRAKSLDQLQSLLLDLKKEKMHLRFRKAAGDLVNTARIRQVRCMIARVKTVINDRAKQVTGEINA